MASKKMVLNVLKIMLCVFCWSFILSTLKINDTEPRSREARDVSDQNAVTVQAELDIQASTQKIRNANSETDRTLSHNALQSKMTNQNVKPDIADQPSNRTEMLKTTVLELQNSWHKSVESYKDVIQKRKPIVDDMVQYQFIQIPPGFDFSKNIYSQLTLDSELKQRIAIALTHTKCPFYYTDTYYDTSFPPVQFICRSNINQPAMITLFTTMYNSGSKFIAFNNTLHVWAKMQPEVKSILYITPDVNDFENNTFELIEIACNLGWDVAIAPQCNNESYPVIRSMFIAGYSLYQSGWYGYANGDILFDRSLLSALDVLHKYENSISTYNLLVGRRHDVKVEPVSDLARVRYQYLRSKLHPDYGIDYFITPRHGFPWHQIPAIVIGRPEVDNYLLWFAIKHENITDVDCTDAILALHQGEDGWKSIKRSVNYNRDIIREVEEAAINQTTNSTLRYERIIGRTDCVSHKLGHVRSPYVHLYKREILRRGKDKEAKCASACCANQYFVVGKHRKPRKPKYI